MSKPKRYELTSEQWRRICDLLPGKPADPGRTGVNNLTFVNGVLWVLRSGAHWHDLPERNVRLTLAGLTSQYRTHGLPVRGNNLYALPARLMRQQLHHLQPPGHHETKWRLTSDRKVGTCRAVQ